MHYKKTNLSRAILLFVCMVFGFLPAKAQNCEWARHMGGIYVDVGNSVMVDANGNVYSTGIFSDTADFDPGAGTYNLIANQGTSDIFISKLDSNGNFIWAKGIGGSAAADSYSITEGADGYIYITGSFIATVDFDPGAGVYNLTSTTPGASDIFIMKTDTSGNLTWAISMGGPSTQAGFSITTDAAGNVYTTGAFQGTSDFDPGPGTYNLSTLTTSYPDVFISKLDSGGNFLWAKSVGEYLADNSTCIKVNADGTIYIAGHFHDVIDFDPGAGTYNLTSAGGYDVFILKLDSGGNFIRVQTIGGDYSEYGTSIALDAGGNLYICGDFTDTVDFDPGAGIYYLTAAPAPFSDVFICKLDSGGNFIWARNMGGPNSESGKSLALDASGNVYTTGLFRETADFDPGPGIYNLVAASLNNYSDIFVSKLDSGGNFVWARGIGSTSFDIGYAIAADAGGSAYVTGYFRDTANFGSLATDTLTSFGHDDIFIAKYDQSAVGIQENNFSAEFKIFPNPANGDFIIETGKLYDAVTVSVFNVTGQKVFNGAYHNTTALNVSMDAPPGVYIVEMRSSEGKTVRVRMVKV